MSLQDILKKISEKADKEISVINLETESLISKVKAKSKDRLEKRIKEVDTNLALAIKDIHKKTESMARREISKRESLEKRKVIDFSLLEFVKYLDALPSNDYTQIIKLLTNNVDDDVQIFCTENRHKEITAIFNGKNINIDKDMKSGLTLKFSNGSEADLSFSSLVNATWKNELEIFFATQLKLLS